MKLYTRNFMFVAKTSLLLKKLSEKNHTYKNQEQMNIQISFVY